MHAPVKDLHPPLPVRSRRFPSLDEKFLVMSIRVESKSDILSSVSVVEIDVENDGSVDVMFEVGWTRRREKNTEAEEERC